MSTADKDLFGCSWCRVIEVAKAHTVFDYEAAVVEDLILRTLVNSIASDKITRVLGVVNGASTTDDQMEEGWSYADALAEAQRLCFAE